jgi:hypothetical protein
MGRLMFVDDEARVIPAISGAWTESLLGAPSVNDTDAWHQDATPTASVIGSVHSRPKGSTRAFPSSCASAVGL